MTYYAREYTDPAGGALTITTDHQGLWITATEGDDEVTVGPFPATTLADAMDGGVAAALIEQEAEKRGPLSVDLPSVVRVINERDDAHARAEMAELERDQARDSAEALRTAVRERGTLIKDLRARAENAERQWNEADRRTAEAEEQRDQWKRHHDRVDGQWAKAEREVTKLRLAAESRPLTPDAISEAEWDQIAARAWEYWEGHTILNSHGLKRMMQFALTEPPARPEGAEEIHQVLDAIYRDEPGITHRGNLADVLASHGIRVTGAES